MSAAHEPAPLAQPRTTASLVRRQADARPDATALFALAREPLTYREFFEQIQLTASVLRSHGIRRNERVALVLPNGPESAAAFVVVSAAATTAPLNPAYRAEEFDFYLSDLRAKALIIAEGMDSPAIEVAQARGVAVLRLRAGEKAGVFGLGDSPGAQGAGEAPDLAEPSDVALVMHTSGTTSRPKIVPLTHANITRSAANIARSLALTSQDRCLNIMPLFHIHGLMAAILATIESGASVVCTPGFDAMKFFVWLKEFDPTWYTAAPTMHQAILARASRHRETAAASRLRLIRSSSASLPPQVLAELESVFGAPVIESYGMTEAAHQMASNPLPPRVRMPGSVGLAAGPEIAVVNEAGELLAAGQTGEVVIRGENVAAGYENNPEANRDAFTNGWFRTGDQGYLDEGGYLYLTGRLKEIINRGGEKISPREVDEVLLDHPAVEQALTFALPHEKLGEDVAAAVVLRDGEEATAKDLRQFAARRLADFKVPRKYVFLDEIPKGPTGKLQRIGLAQALGLADKGSG
jgi:acyl-CoA synthetase (AMP-forming)/AMP-acid ligase II